MHTVYIRDPWSARCVPVDFPSSLTVGGLASALGVAVSDPVVLVYGGMRDLMPICAMSGLDQFSEVSTLGSGICLAFPEMPAIVFDRLFGGVWDTGLLYNREPVESFMLYLEAKFKDLVASRVPAPTPHRRVQFVVHHAWNRDQRDVFSMSSGVEVAQLRLHVLRAIPVEAHRRCQVLAHSRVIAHRSSLRIRDITTDDRNPVVFLRVVVGARGGTTKRKLALDDGSCSSDAGANQEAYDEECAAASSSAQQGSAFDEPPDPLATLECPPEFIEHGMEADWRTAVMLGMFPHLTSNAASASSAAAAVPADPAESIAAPSSSTSPAAAAVPADPAESNAAPSSSTSPAAAAVPADPAESNAAPSSSTSPAAAAAPPLADAESIEAALGAIIDESLDSPAAAPVPSTGAASSSGASPAPGAGREALVWGVWGGWDGIEGLG
jgi:hypothetical protein